MARIKKIKCTSQRGRKNKIVLKHLGENRAIDSKGKANHNQKYSENGSKIRSKIQEQRRKDVSNHKNFQNKYFVPTVVSYRMNFAKGVGRRVVDERCKRFIAGPR